MPDGSNDVLGLGADAELAAPDAEAGGDVVVSVSALVAAPRALVDVVSNPGDGPYLATVGVTAELEVYAGLLGMVKMVGLMVEQDGKRLPLLPPKERVFSYQFLEGLAAHVGAVVASDDGNARVDDGVVVDEKVDAGIAVELAGFGRTAIVLVVTEAGIDGGVESAELFGHALFDERTDADVDDIARNQYEVGLFGIDEVNPPGKLTAGIVVADVQVADHDYAVVVRQGFGGRQA